VIGTNPGVPAGPLREIASGGELSRVMLALMSATSARAGAATVVFDEVDAGVGGATARSVGEKLRQLGAARQVLCITHLPQVASLAERHFRVTKRVGRSEGGGGPDVLATTRVERLEDTDVVNELCRMLGSDPADKGARRHAEDLLKAA
jgi:DNA repair protein RecN (Recombination protein N)